MDIDFYRAVLICLVNMLGMKDRKGVSIVDAFEKILKESDKRNQIKYGLIKEVNFKIILLKNS